MSCAQNALRLRLAEARRRGDTEQARRVCRVLDNIFVALAHVRVDDPDVRRLRGRVKSSDALDASCGPTSPSTFGLTRAELVAEAARLRASGWTAQEISIRLARPGAVPQQREGDQ